MVFCNTHHLLVKPTSTTCSTGMIAPMTKQSLFVIVYHCSPWTTIQQWEMINGRERNKNELLHSGEFLFLPIIGSQPSSKTLTLMIQEGSPMICGFGRKPFFCYQRAASLRFPIAILRACFRLPLSYSTMSTILVRHEAGPRVLYSGLQRISGARSYQQLVRQKMYTFKSFVTTGR
jgi:hypothetical protein